MVASIPLSTTEMPPAGYRIMGLVSGIQVKSMNIFTDILTGFANLVGTGKKDWTKVQELYDRAREEAIDAMIADAPQGTTDIIGVRIDVSELSRGQGQGMLVVAAYGTAIAKDSQSAGGRGRSRRRRGAGRRKTRGARGGKRCTPPSKRRCPVATRRAFGARSV